MTSSTNTRTIMNKKVDPAQKDKLPKRDLSKIDIPNDKNPAIKPPAQKNDRVDIFLNTELVLLADCLDLFFKIFYF